MTQTLNNFFKKAINAWRINRAAKETITELSKLTNRELNDIGLSRGDIWHVAYHDAQEKHGTAVDEVYANPNLRGFV